LSSELQAINMVSWFPGMVLAIMYPLRLECKGPETTRVASYPCCSLHDRGICY